MCIREREIVISDWYSSEFSERFAISVSISTLLPSRRVEVDVSCCAEKLRFLRRLWASGLPKALWSAEWKSTSLRLKPAVFAFAMLMTIPAAFLTLSGRLIYPFYEAAPRITVLSALEDQRLGGLIMWVPGFGLYLIAITAVWFRWTKDEYAEWREEAREARARTALARS